MTNEDIQQKAFVEVRRYEKANHRKATVHQSDGFDLISRDQRRNAIVRHIEVKGTTRHSVSFRWLENNEYKALKNDKRYFLYIVTGVGTRQMKVHEFSRTKTLKHYKRKEIKYIFVFTKRDFR